MNKDHLSSNMHKENMKTPISLNFTMKREVFHRTKLLVGIESIMCRSFTIVVADLRFTQCHHQPKLKKNLRGRPDRLWLVVTLGESENGHDDRETCTQGALHPSAQLCLIEDPTLHCKV
ncbi:predicted protein [Lichtheimia corymbifera JMRC:FSU:9682]|uniref:Uncharacterized protein n=1 Tax=Lichtheimia corymbifera JMRC:FSU:9682 TaxID=1263082 RepID=A0A068SCR8_9FUNG|nr:predicted protein [Lichtheimia corymbifera JMRC:FSU:9682]